MFGRILCRCRHRSARSRQVRRPRRTAGDFGPEGKEAIQLRDSTIAEVIILAITYLGAFVSIRFFSATVSTWHSLVTESGRRFTLAGYWYALISLPIYQFLVYRWLWRRFIWCRFLRRVSKLDLQLIPTHPDQAGGVGFLGETHRLYAIFIFAFSAISASLQAECILQRMFEC